MRAWLALLVAVTGCRQVFGLNDPIARDASTVDAPADAPAGFVTIGGSVVGLAGTGLVLENDGGDDLSVESDGPFQFRMSVLAGTAYDVTASQQPTLPSQMCSVANASGTANTSVTDVTIVCTTLQYQISGTVYGLLASQSVKLALNGGNDITVTGDGSGAQPFTFGQTLASGASFVVSITNESQATCSVSGGNGQVGGGPVGGVAVNCATNSYTISGTVTGLNGTVTISDGPDQVSVSSTAFAFPPLTAGTAYDVTIVTDPEYPPIAQTCTLASNTSGTLLANVSDVQITCSTNAYSVGGELYELGSGAVTVLNNTEHEMLVRNGPFAFSTPVASGMTYDVTVTAQPPGQQCVIKSGAGTVTNGNVTSVVADCDSGISCGTSFCQPGVQDCCLVQTASPACMAVNQCPAPDVAVPCDDATDCALEGHPGSSCCLNTLTLAIACAPSCTGANEQTMCSPSGPDFCPAGKVCNSSTKLTGYYTCQ